MNVEVLNKLMEINKVNSYFQLAKEVKIPYTTLLDLVNGRGERLSNIRIIADYFNVSISTLVEQEITYITVDEEGKIKEKKKEGYNSVISILISNY